MNLLAFAVVTAHGYAASYYLAIQRVLGLLAAFAADTSMLAKQFYEMGDSRDLPAEARGEFLEFRYRLWVRHRMREPRSGVDDGPALDHPDR